MPLAVEWAKREEDRVFKNGIALSPPQIQLARQACVQHPEKVRILEVSSVPFPSDAALQQAAVNTGILTNLNDAVTFGYGICLRKDQVNNRCLLARELVLVACHEQLGGIEPFLRKYLQQVIVNGADLAPMEIEAAEVAERICS